MALLLLFSAFVGPMMAGAMTEHLGFSWASGVREHLNFSVVYVPPRSVVINNTKREQRRQQFVVWKMPSLKYIFWTRMAISCRVLFYIKPIFRQFCKWLEPKQYQQFVDCYCLDCVLEIMLDVLRTNQCFPCFLVGWYVLSFRTSLFSFR